MPKPNIVVGLDLGTTRVRVAVAEVFTDAETRIICIGQSDSHGIRKGEIVDFEAARAAVREAISEAESKSDLEIHSAFVGLSGGHLASLNNRGVLEMPTADHVIDEADLQAVKSRACEVNIPASNSFVHAELREYRVDGREGVFDPIGILGHRLEADYHIIHGIRARMQNTVRLVKDVPLEVDDIVVSGLASALGALDEAQRERGVLLLDLGGGVTDYAIYREGAVCASGCLAVGGDHITNDISMGLRIPIARAERLKIDEGSAVLGTCLPDERIHLRAEPGFAARDVEREMLNQIIHYRLREVFELIKERFEDERHLPYLGAGVILTGGASGTSGIQHLAEEIFGLPVSPANPPRVTGLAGATENPQLSAVLGIVEFARAINLERPPTGFFARFKSAFGKIFRR